MGEGFPSGQELTTSGGSDTSCTLPCESPDGGNQKQAGTSLHFRPRVTPFSFAANPWVVFPASFRKSGVGVTLPGAAATAQIPRLLGRVPGRGGWLVRGRLHLR